MSKSFNLSKEEISFIKQRKKMIRSKLAAKFNARFNRSFTTIQVTNICKRFGFLCGRTGHFEKNHLPWNTGTRGICKSNSGCFKVGQKSHTQLPVGSEIIDSEGYHKLKISDPNKWKFKHVLLWEKEYNSKVPEGHIILFKDCNRSNLDIENLICISRTLAVRLNYNKYSKSPEEFKQTIFTMSELQTKISEKERKK